MFVIVMLCTLHESQSLYSHGLRLEEYKIEEEQFEGLDSSHTNFEVGFYTVTLNGEQSVTVSETISQLNEKGPFGFFSFTCLLKEFKTCKVNLKIEDSNGFVFTEIKDIENATYKIYYERTGEFRFTFSNNEYLTKDISIGLNCYHCGQETSSGNFLSKGAMNQKLIKLEEIKRMLGNIMTLTTISKRTVASFTSNTIKAESRLQTLASIELLVVVLVSIWQVYYIKRLISRRRMI